MHNILYIFICVCGPLLGSLNVLSEVTRITSPVSARSGAHDTAKTMIEDVLTIRAEA